MREKPIVTELNSVHQPGDFAQVTGAPDGLGSLLGARLPRLPIGEA
jgi:hypothetical protein